MCGGTESELFARQGIIRSFDPFGRVYVLRKTETHVLLNRSEQCINYL